MQYQKLCEPRTAQEKQVTALERLVHLSGICDSGGLSRYLDALDAQRGLFNAQLALAQTRGGQLFAKVEFYEALGNGRRQSKLYSSRNQQEPSGILRAASIC